MDIVSTKTLATTPERLVRLAATTNWTVGDTDMKSVYVHFTGWKEFRPLVTAGWKVTGDVNVWTATPICSRVYLPSVVEHTDGSAVVCMKLGVKEVNDASAANGGLPFEKSDWGMYLVKIDPLGSVLWKGRYAIHKGNAQVVWDPDENSLWLIASTGIRWWINPTNGEVTKKDSVPMGESGEKNYSTSTACSFIGYTGHPSSVTRFGVDSKSIPVCSKPPYETGDDMLYCRHISPYGKPKAIWWVTVLNGRLAYNFIGPKAKSAKFSMANLPYAGAADKEARHAPSLYVIPGDKAHVGVVFKDDGKVWAQVLDKPETRKALGSGAFPVAVQTPTGFEARYVSGNSVVNVVVTHEGG